MTKTAKKTEKKTEVSDTERLDAAKMIVAHAFPGGPNAHTPALVIRIYHLIAEDAGEDDLVSLTQELEAVKTGLGDNATPEQVLAVHHALVEDEDGMMLEDAGEIEEQIDAAREVLTAAFDAEQATKAENLVAFLGA